MMPNLAISCEDCLAGMSRLGDHSINMILCDLPYGTTQNKWDSVIPLDALWHQYRRIAKPDAAIVLTSQGVFTAELILSQSRIFKYKIVWQKSKPTNFLNVSHQPLRKHEDVCVFYRHKPTYNPVMGLGAAYDKGVRKDQLTGSYGEFRPARITSDGGRYPTDVIYFRTAEGDPGGSWHPAQKPVDLGRYLIRTYSNEGDVILDNAFGSGAFLAAALMEKRRAIGFENDPDYFSRASQRLATLNKDTTNG